MKITITGTSGFVGQNLTNFLIGQSHQVASLSMRNTTWISQIDLESDALIHLAGKAHDTSNTAEASEYFDINTTLTKVLFDVFLESNIKDFIYFSSVKAVADTVEGVLYEEVIGRPMTPYGQSKLQAEQYLISKTLPEGKRLLIIRPCMIHGPGNKGNLNLLYKIVNKGIPWPLAAYDNKRSFLSIDNLNFLIYQLLINKNVKSGVYNFADDKSLSTNELVRLIASASNKQAKLWSINKKFMDTIAIIGDKVGLPLNTERLKKLTENYKVSNSKIKKALGIENLPYSASEGLKKTVTSFK
ncbi:NAD-dependent epimerase/dehydratase family protein [Flavobacterium sp. NKUCC04_CG]|uniref:NAD-dependent epimerase/dehydratase family protein n=1 Tax=Flavobacterium sp. NKUCC04_CG TaxID=2842121 RepID=UPI001C5ABC7B|nr:NAD-dependent epimerase/dehydratase family protein [Flavobacterium sp. NKUCC04_CG]MBW3517560.1 NAD-dependent epimerase/dehydratase family protein [Flavobacterium sp. NKUCC04_CG]